MPAMGASSGSDLLIASGQEVRLLRNVAVGDVWLASGQSNMAWQMNLARFPERDIPEANYQEIRLFGVAPNPDVDWKGDVAGQWQPCTPDSVRNFSAVAYFFGRSLHLTEKVPIGLIDASLGGSGIQAWSPPSLVSRLPELENSLKALKERLQEESERNAEINRLRQERGLGVVADLGNRGELLGWQNPDISETDWTEAFLPQPYSRVPGLTVNGTVWFRRTIELPQSWSGKEAVLSLGPIDDSDVTYFNGFQVGATGESGTGGRLTKRTYKVPSNLVRPGINTIAVRVHDRGDEGGFVGVAGDMTLRSGQEALSVAGRWTYRVERGVPNLERTSGRFNRNSPSALWQGMIRPLTPLPLKGVIWYQGEGASRNPDIYGAVFPEMIKSWREAFQQPQLPFIYVQLPNFELKDDLAPQNAWALLREQQDKALLLPKTAGIVTIDVGEAFDIHPRDKTVIGERLAMAARAIAYPGSSPAGLSPRIESWSVTGRNALVTFSSAPGLRTAFGSGVTGFEVKGPNGEWSPAAAAISGNSVVVRGDSVTEILGVRYAWANNPTASLFTSTGLPVSPFQVEKQGS